MKSTRSCAPTARKWSWWRHVLVATALGGCFAEGYPHELTPIQVGDSGGAGAGGTNSSDGGEGGNAGEPSVPPDVCSPVATPEVLNARSVVMSETAATGSQLVFVENLFQTFKTNCGGCHVDSNLGDFKVTAGNFISTVGEDSIERMMEEDPLKFMPPPPVGKKWSERSEGDAIKSLVQLLRVWIDAGKPADVFTVETGSMSESPYLMTPEVGSALTNLGNCVPTELYYVGPKTEELDELFAGLQRSAPGEGTPEERVGLPARLDQTDLFTFDSSVLAQNGVVAFAPTYPLWSDGSGKLRHVRVPKGKSISFNEETREFEIPDNTRFYKTFFKKIIDHDGSETHRKIETRLIVARQDRENEDGSFTHTALYGTYAWNEDETEALLVTDALRNGEPFRDRVFTYITDEPGAAAVKAQVPPPPHLGYALEAAGVVRHYAIPGADRCVQCHMGSQSHSFVLGFTPLQLNRLKKGEQGVFEETSEDETRQLQRLIDWGVITGMAPQEDVVLLEDSQGERKPRNEHELLAQAYMFGNCAHCHNPTGYPSVLNPGLAPLLNFYPSTEGGIFQFPLDRFSPRTTRGANGQTLLPYITPSLYDVVGSGSAAKWSQRDATVEYLDAPWRSLIYRNVDTPFTYADDYAIFPHMPMNTAGFDCRAPRILGDWMVSVPALRSNPTLPEGATFAEATYDDAAQPYVEVKPGEPDYDAALLAADKRLETYRSGERYGFCPDTSDITDPAVMRGDVTTPVDEILFYVDPTANEDPQFLDHGLIMPLDGVPDRPHFVISDFTEVPGDWNPRRTDWESVLKDGEFPELPPEDLVGLARQADEMQIVEMLQDITITSAVRAYATEPRPMGFWKDKPDCDFSGVSKLGEIPVGERAHWMTCENVEGSPSECDDAPIFAEPPGSSIFTSICSNCHGRQLDAQGIQAKTVADLTGGVARVANFRTGLFGPEGDGDNRERIFGHLAGGELSTDDWAARYLTWMGLGGTLVRIPDTILTLVSRTPVLGHLRRDGFGLAGSANMLSVAQEMCRFVLPALGYKTIPWTDFKPWMTGLYDLTPLVTQVGDSQLWLELCSLNNPPPIRIFHAKGTQLVEVFDQRDFHDRSQYPAGVPVGNHLAGVEPSLSAGNLFPWCLYNDEEGQEFAATQTLDGTPIPLCPEAFQTLPNWVASIEGGSGHDDDFEPWLQRGAINAGLMVYIYVDQVTEGDVTPRYYDRFADL